MFFITFLAAIAAVCAQVPDALPTTPPAQVALPVYLSLSPNLNDFNRFANGGPDASWYIGFNNAWIVKLPPAPAGEYSRAYIGAKIGRAKTRAHPNKPWLREIVDGNVYMAISPTASFAPEQNFFLASASDIPAEADPQNYVEGVGEAQWFWHEVPLAAVSFTQPNYLVIWSRSNYFAKASSSPILAAAKPEDAAPGAEPRAWNNRSILGVPPRIAATALETPLNNFYPALAIKLVPPNDDEVSVAGMTVTRAGKSAVVDFAVGGANIIEAWVESSKDQLDWISITKVRRQPPYMFTIGPDKFPAPGGFLRAVARDSSGNLGASTTHSIPYAPH